MAGLDGKVHETPLPPSVVGVVDVSEFAAVVDAVGFRQVASLPAESCFPLVAGRPGRPVNRGAQSRAGDVNPTV